MVNFDYGIIEYKHRFSIRRSLDDYKVTRLEKCISVSSQFLYKTMACDKLIHELHIAYRNANGKTELLKLDLHDYTFKVIYVGNCSVCV